MHASRALLVVFALAAVFCGGSNQTPLTETFSGTIRDAPNAEGQSHDVSVGEAGMLAATLAWVPQQSSQPTGQALLAMTLRDRAGAVVFDTYGAPSSNPTIASAPVRRETYTLTVRPQFRERIGFYCLCDVPYSVVVVHH